MAMRLYNDIPGKMIFTHPDFLPFTEFCIFNVTGVPRSSEGQLILPKDFIALEDYIKLLKEQDEKKDISFAKFLHLSSTEIINLTRLSKAALTDVAFSLPDGKSKILLELSSKPLFGDTQENGFIFLKTRHIHIGMTASSNATFLPGASYSAYPKTSIIQICNYTVFPDDPHNFFHVATTCLTEPINNTIQVYSNALSIYILELTKTRYIVEKYEKDIASLTDLEAIVLFLKFCGDAKRTDMIDSLIKHWPIFKKPKDYFDSIKANYGEYVMKLTDMIREMDIKSTEAYVRKRYAEETAKQIADATAKARAEERAEARAEICKNTAKILLEDKCTVDYVMKVSGLSRKEVEDIQEELKDEGKI
jgi:hypothetical protein